VELVNFPSPAFQLQFHAINSALECVDQGRRFRVLLWVDSTQYAQQGVCLDTAGPFPLLARCFVVCWCYLIPWPINGEYPLSTHFGAGEYSGE